MSNELATVQQHGELATTTVDDVLERLHSLQDLMARAMAINIDYGQIPGTNSKPTLLKPGAEKLCVMFRLCPHYDTQKTWDGKHLTIETVCTIKDMRGNVLGQATAMCSTKEAKYAYRKQERTCPQCGKAAIIKGKAEYGGGWLCWKKKDGCGAQFKEGDARIEGQSVGRADNPDLPDSYNTVMRIAEKRAFIAAVRLTTGSSALFDEESPEYERPVDTHADKPIDAEIVPPAKPPEQPIAATVNAWLERLDPNTMTVDKLNALLPEVKAITHAITRKKVWADVQNFAEVNSCAWDDGAKKFIAKNEPARDVGDEPEEETEVFPV